VPKGAGFSGGGELFAAKKSCELVDIDPVGAGKIIKSDRISYPSALLGHLQRNNNMADYLCWPLKKGWVCRLSCPFERGGKPSYAS
jgi:hypothetical protein